MNTTQIRALLQATVEKWREEQMNHHAGAVSYFVWLASIPLLILYIGFGGFFLNTREAQQTIVNHVQDTVGGRAAEMMDRLLQATYQDQTGGILATVIAIGTLLFLASYLFVHLRKALNDIWDTHTPEDRSLSTKIRERIFSVVGVVVVAGVLLGLLLLDIFLPSLLAGTALSSFLGGVVQAVTALLTLGVLTLILAAIFRYVPHADIAWDDVWVGALFTALLILVGQVLITLYLQLSTVTSAYGIAGTILAVLLWVYYSVHSLLAGAVFTYVYAHAVGSNVEQGQSFGHPEFQSA